jgi:hypothetical protein
LKLQPTNYRILSIFEFNGLTSALAAISNLMLSETPMEENLAFKKAMMLSLDGYKPIHVMQGMRVIYQGLNCSKCGANMELIASGHFITGNHC